MLDTSVIVSAFRSRHGASRQLLGLVGHRRLVALASVALFLEYEDVLKRAAQRAVSGLNLEQVDVALRAIANLVEPVDVRFSWRPQLNDPDDEMVLDAAINGRADALVTHNIAHFEAASRRFGLKTIRPGDLWKELMI